MKRRYISRRKSRRIFSNTARRVHKRNLKRKNSRGGIRF